MQRSVMYEQVKLPYSTAKVQRQQARLVADTILNKYVGRRLDEMTILSLAEYLSLKLGYDDVPPSFYALSLDSFRMKAVNKPDWHRRLRRIAASVESFRAGQRPLRPVTDWLRQEEDEWSPVWVHTVTGHHNATCQLSCFVLAGQAAEVNFEYRISPRMAWRIAVRSGFSQRSEVYQFFDARQFASLNLLLLIGRGSTPSQVKIGDVALNNAIRTANRKIIRERSEAYRDCPFDLHVGCHRCGIGRNDCDLATQQVTSPNRYQHSVNEAVDCCHQRNNSTTSVITDKP